MAETFRIWYKAASLLDKSPRVPSAQSIERNGQKKLPAVLLDNPEWILPYSNIRNIDVPAPSIHQTTQPRPILSLGQSLEIPRLVINSNNTNISNLEFVTPMNELTLPPDGHYAHTGLSSGNVHENGSHLSPGETSSRSSRSSLMTIKSLRSSYDDVLSLMERHTISGSSATISSARTSQMSKSSRHLSMQSDLTVTASNVKYSLTSPTKLCPPVVLPGAFHQFCWAQIDKNSLGSCRQDGLLCEHVTPSTNRFFVSKFDLRGVIYNRVESRGITELDSFGNSILHVAACLGAPIPYLISLVREIANVHIKNNSGETFLHLVRVPTEGDEMCTLLDELSAHQFDFSQRDDHGQTSVHILTRSWYPQQYLIKVIKKLNSLGLRLPSSRDNLGYSLMDQMKYPFTGVSSTNEAEDLVQSSALQYELSGVRLRQSSDPTCESIDLICHSSIPEDQARPLSEDNRSTHRVKNHASIRTILGPQRFEQHADLLKTINTASHIYWFEDSYGRNGLHCLAEVAFYPHARGCIEDGSQYSNMDVVEDSGNMREDSLDGLLAVGVDPNNYDKEGNTPMMAFIIHTHPTEDDKTITHILKKLINANADIDRRNRQGETALHLAVKLGRRAATKFLLENGANVHARNKNGEGVLEIGHRTLKACRSLNSDVTIYAQILLCMCLTQISGAIPRPTILNEWSSPTTIKCSRKKSSTYISADQNKRVKK